MDSNQERDGYKGDWGKSAMGWGDSGKVKGVDMIGRGGIGWQMVRRSIDPEEECS